MEAGSSIKMDIPLTKYIALDCEMVRVGKNYRQDVLARVSLVNEHLQCVYDKYVKTARPVTDYRTRFSGIREADLAQGEDFETVRRKVIEFLQGRILVGHGLNNDFHALKYEHPEDDVRDTSFYFEKMYKNRTPSLKLLADDFLKVEIQRGEHSSIDDATACMQIYQVNSVKWERDLVRQTQMKPNVAPGARNHRGHGSKFAAPKQKNKF